MNEIERIISKMSLEDKIRLCSGASFWESEKMEEYGIPSLFMSDGPHGLRTQKGEADHLGINESEKATCFPTASASAASWNPLLLKEMGVAIGEEAAYFGVDVVLGPGVNIKRNPLCGRNFEYFSEDPFLSGVMGTSWVEGVQSKGIGTSLKHFAANNQEQDRMMSNSLVDERALREIYLSAFERVVRLGKPNTIMCSYNQINGIFSSDNKKLLTDILRKEWNFEGLVVTDWGAMNDRIAAFKAGCDLEMPNSCGFFDEEIKKAVQSGRLLESEIDVCVSRIIKEARKAQETRKKKDNTKDFKREEHHNLAKRIIEESAVLLKNEENILPLCTKKKVALCGMMAEEVRYQGAGSSHINPTKISGLKAAMEQMTDSISFYPGYQKNGERQEQWLKSAVEGAQKAEVVVVVAGLPESFESEGYDRMHMRMPDSHNELIFELAKVNENIIVVLMGGSPVEMPWIKEVKAILNLYLGGQAVGEAGAELLYGLKNPSGKLAETYPITYEDVSSSETFGINPRQVEYAESIYVGYRYYDKAGIAVQFPFGHGLSYTKFEISDLEIRSESSGSERVFAVVRENELKISCKVSNIGDRAGAEVVQIYVADRTPDLFKASKELKGFQKVYLNPGEEKKLEIYLDKECFSHFDMKTKSWEVRTGEYQIYVGVSSQQLCLSGTIKVEGTVDTIGYEEVPEWYLEPLGKPNLLDFEKIYGQKIHVFKPEKPGQFTMYNTFHDMWENPGVQQIFEGMKQGVLQGYNGNEEDPGFIFTLSIIKNTPLIRLVQQGGGKTPLSLMQAVVGVANNDPEAVKHLTGKKSNNQKV